MNEKIATYGYGNVDLRLSDYKNNITILTITNISWALQLSYNLLNIMPLAKKSIKVFLR